MRRMNWFQIVIGTGFMMACATVSHAQAGPCSSASINQAFTAVLHRAPRGSGNTGECNPNNYGAGSWNGQADLMKRVGAASYCTDPWIGQEYLYLLGRYPSNAECNGALYGGGHWSSYMDLGAKVQAYQQALHTPAQPLQIQTRLTQQRYTVDAQGNLRNSSNQIVAYAGHYYINAGIVASGAGNIVASGAGNIVASGAGNVVPQPGMMVSTNGSNFITPR
jgi:F0F1-type ATP synthase membrane subunit c/vacuolar-type H+-ATPase subunit K